MRILFLSYLLTVLTTAVTFAADEKQRQPSKPATELEAFLGSTGNIIVKEFHGIGFVEGKSGTVELTTLVLYEPGSESRKKKGMKIEVHGGGRFEKEGSAFLDLEEMNSLSRAIEYMSKVAKDWEAKQREYTEVIYSTKGDFQIGFYIKDRQVSAFAKSGHFGDSTAFLSIESLGELKQKVDAGIEFLKNK